MADKSAANPNAQQNQPMSNTNTDSHKYTIPQEQSNTYSQEDFDEDEHVSTGKNTAKNLGVAEIISNKDSSIVIQNQTSNLFEQNNNSEEGIDDE
jgi:hypothetical protein